METDYEKIAQKLRQLGGMCLEIFDNADAEFEADKTVELWNLHGEAILLMTYENEDYGLYHFVGDEGDPLEKDLQFLEKLARKNQCVCGHGTNDHINEAQGNVCGSRDCPCTDFQSSAKNILAEQMEFAQRHGE